MIRSMTSRANRIAIFGALALVLLVGGTVLATRAPQAPSEPAQLGQDGEENEVEAPPTAEELAHVADRLTRAEITYTDEQLSDFATRFGVGGAVRLLAWADAGHDLDSLLTKREVDGMGWGQIAREIGEHPGIGRIMGNGNGNGHGRENAPGQQGDAEE